MADDKELAAPRHDGWDCLMHVKYVQAVHYDTALARIRELEAREAEAWALLTDVRFCGRSGLHDDIDKWLAAYPRDQGGEHE